MIGPQDVRVPFGKKVSVSSVARVIVTGRPCFRLKVKRGQSGRAAADATKRWVVLGHVSHGASLRPFSGSSAEHPLPVRIAPARSGGGRGRHALPSAHSGSDVWQGRDPQRVSSSS